MKRLTPRVFRLSVTASLLAFGFSALGQIVPGDARLAGMYYIVPDVACWFSAAGNYVTNGYINTAIGQAASPADLGNWEPYTSVMGDTTFLVEFNTYANDLTLANQNWCVAQQPASGAPAKISYAFYDDSGAPAKGQINLSRQNGNPGRVAGDKRIGGAKYITECEVSIGQVAGFQSTARWNNAIMYVGNNRYAGEQLFNLNPNTLATTPVTNAWDYVYGPLPPTPFGANADTTQNSRTGGRPEFLDNGNIM